MNKDRLRRRPRQTTSVAQKLTSLSSDGGLDKSDATNHNEYPSVSLPAVVSLPVHSFILSLLLGEGHIVASWGIGGCV